MKYWDFATESKIIYSLGIWILKSFYLGAGKDYESEYWLGSKFKDCESKWILIRY